MAFVSKIRNMLKQTVSKHLNLELSTSNPSIFQAIRCMSSSKLFVGGLPYATDEMSLREAFAQYGVVVEAKVVTDRETGRSRGFGFVTYTSSDEASTAIQALDGKDFQGRWLKVNYAVQKPRSGGFGGGYGGNSSYDYSAGGGGGSGYQGSEGYGGLGSSYNMEASYNSGDIGGNSYFSGNAGGLATGEYTGTTEASSRGVIEDGNRDCRQEKMEDDNKEEADDNNYANVRN